jgi:hypothetical protein
LVGVDVAYVKKFVHWAEMCVIAGEEKWAS